MDIGWSEILIIGVVALIVVGPKDLPGMFRTLGKFTAKIRRMAREFTRAMEDAADESGVKETAADLKKMTSPKKMGLDKINEAIDDWDPTKPSKKAKDIGSETAKLAEERAAAAKAARENADANAAKWAKPAKDAPTEIVDAPEPSAPKSETGS